MLSPTENSRIQGLFKAFERFSSTFQGRFNFHGLFKKALKIQVLFKHRPTLFKVTLNTVNGLIQHLVFIRTSIVPSVLQACNLKQFLPTMAIT